MKLAVIAQCENIENITNLFKIHLPRDELCCFVDENSKEEIYSSNGISFVTPITLHKTLQMKELDYLIIIEESQFAFRNLLQSLYKYEIPYSSIIYYTCFINFEKKARSLKSFNKIIENSYNKIPYIHSLDYEVAEYCNLNCNRCNHFSNIAEKHNFPDVASFEKDLRKLNTIIEHIGTIYLLGGEPLLNPELDKFLYIAHEILPETEIVIISNGILITQMSDALINTIKTTNTTLRLSIYPPMYNKSEQLLEFMKQCHIKHDRLNYIKTFSSFINPKGNSPPQKAMHSCLLAYAHAIKNGILYKCCMSMNISRYNKKFYKSMPENNGFDLYSNYSVNDLREYLLNPIPLCSYCNQPSLHEWEKSENQYKAEDWYSDIFF